jgi:hypothetical protein
MLPASTKAICIVMMSSAEGFSDDVMGPFGGTSLATNAKNHPTVTLDQAQKEELLYAVFDKYVDNPIPEE